MPNNIQKLIKHSKNPKLIEEAFEFAKETYGDEKWLGGQELVIDHAVQMAFFLQEMSLDEETIAAVLLYGAGNTKEKLENIKKKFGSNIAYIVKKCVELDKIYYSTEKTRKEKGSVLAEKTEKIIKMFFAIAKDTRVILIKLASRIDGLKNFDKLPHERREFYAKETLEIFVPIANRLGLGEVKRTLEDLAFEYLDKKTFNWLKENVIEKYEERQKYLEKFIPRFKKILKKEKIKYFEVNYRAKSYWSTYQKLKRYNMDFERIYDLVALRLIVKDVTTCYKALGIIHKYFKPMSGQIQDYIAKPKENGYKSIHTTVFIDDDRVSEIQIKTDGMNKEAMFGICAHWAYKENFDLAKDPEKLKFSEKIPYFIKTFKIDFFENEIFAFTPKGDIISLPKGSTAVDFAYAVHSDIGNHCESAKIDGKIIPLSRPLNNGEVVEIITSKKKQPSIDWLRFVQTGFAKSHIKKIFSVTFGPIISVPTFIGKTIIGIVKKPKTEQKPPKEPKNLELYVGGQKNIAVSFAKCCSPSPGDIAMAYIGKFGPAVLHKNSCKNFQKVAQKFPQKVLKATWQKS